MNKLLLIILFLTLLLPAAIQANELETTQNNVVDIQYNVPILKLCVTIDSQPQGPLTHYVIVRSDLPRGLLAAQVTHAAGESINERVPEGTHAIVLAAKDEVDLKRIHRHIIEKGIPHKCITECDNDYKGQLMAIGLEPKPKELVRKQVSSIPLLV